MHVRTLLPGDTESVSRLCSEFLTTSLDLPALRSATRRLSTDPDWIPDVDLQGQAPEVPSNNVPLPEFDETGLLGRREETGKLLQLLQRRHDRVVTLVGEGGIGKTALAVKVLDEYLHSVDCPVAAVLWTSLKTERLTGAGVHQIVGAARDVLSNLDEWLSVVGEDEHAGVDALAEVLEGLPALVVIDNLETVSASEVIDFIDRLPRDTHFLLTSRVGLGQLERRVQLGPLSERDAGLLLCRLAETRGVERLATRNAEQLAGQASRLRRNPLAIRWYVEAVAAGRSPDELLANQRDFLRFCLETIYEDLSELARQILGVLHVADGPLDVPQLSVVTGLESDEIRRSLHELDRRSLVVTELLGDMGTHEVFDVSSSAAQYLSSVSRPDDTLVEQVQRRATELRASRERHSLRAASNPLSPYVFGDGSEHEAVVHMLGEAMRLARANGYEQALDTLARAESLDPEYYEVFRARAFVSSRARPALATENYRRARTLAPDSEARARVDYFFAIHLATVERDLDAAEQLARSAHEHFGSPTTAARLGRVLTFRQDWDEAERLVRFAATDDDVRGALIARTQLVNLAKRRLEYGARTERLPAKAISDAVVVVDETQAYLATGRVDSRLVEELISLCCEVVHIGARLPDLASAKRELLDVIRVSPTDPVPSRQARNASTSNARCTCSEAVKTAQSSYARRLGHCSTSFQPAKLMISRWDESKTSRGPRALGSSTITGLTAFFMRARYRMRMIRFC